MVKGTTAPELKHGVYNLSDVNKFGDIAYIPGTGPEGAQCAGCAGCAFIAHSRGAEAARLRNVTLDDVGYIDRGTSACKYFAPRPEGVKPWKVLDDRRDVGDAGSGGGAGADPGGADGPAVRSA